jgi:hypothetical protein
MCTPACTCAGCASPHMGSARAQCTTKLRGCTLDLHGVARISNSHTRVTPEVDRFAWPGQIIVSTMTGCMIATAPANALRRKYDLVELPPGASDVKLSWHWKTIVCVKRGTCGAVHWAKICII